MVWLWYYGAIRSNGVGRDEDLCRGDAPRRTVARFDEPIAFCSGWYSSDFYCPATNQAETAGRIDSQSVSSAGRRCPRPGRWRRGRLDSRIAADVAGVDVGDGRLLCYGYGCEKLEQKTRLE